MWASKVIYEDTLLDLLEWAYKLGSLRPVRGQKGVTEADGSPMDKEAEPTVGSGTRHFRF